MILHLWARIGWIDDPPLVGMPQLSSLARKTSSYKTASRESISSMQEVNVPYPIEHAFYNYYIIIKEFTHMTSKVRMARKITALILRLR